MRAKKSLGQNFLHDEVVIARIVSSLALDENDTVIEIGPGLGALTAVLLEKASHLIAIEFDRDMVAVLTGRFGHPKNFELINADALNVDFGKLLSVATSDRAKLVANLPYNISTPILQILIDQRHLFSRLVLMFQKEVAERISAKPGTKDRGFLSVLTQNAFDIDYLFDVAPGAFRPIPKIWSAVVRLTPKATSVENEMLFRELVSRSFSQKRKTILNNLKSVYDDASTLLESCGIDGNRRAETLTLCEWAALTAKVALVKNAGA